MDSGLPAIQFVRSTPGITTALVGMSNVDHVDENLQLVEIEPVTKEQFQVLMRGVPGGGGGGGRVE